MDRSKLKERFAMWVAWRLPKSIAYWAFVRVAVHDINEYPGDRSVHAAAEAWSA